MRKTLEVLVEQMKQVEATDIHFTAENIFHTQNLTSVVSVYDNIKPSHMVLDELTECAENNNKEVLEKIETLKYDMSWNPKI